MILADRASLFLVDVKTNQLYARLFNIEMDRDLEVDNDINEELIRLYLEKESVDNSKCFRFSIDEGVAGYVARTGKPINLADAYRCQYFNPGVDQDVLDKFKLEM